MANPNVTNASEVAIAFLLLSQPSIGDGITNLKLQKLLYYAQGLHLAIHNGVPLFSEKVLAWEHGPVVENVYHDYKINGSQIIERPETKSNLEESQLEFIKEIWKIFGQFSAWKLREMTHEESPWKETPQSEEITQGKMQSYFKTRLA